MEDMERQKFEDNIKDAFTNAEMNPSLQVWNSIELGIVKAESERLKQRMLFFKMLAAASVVFGMAVAGASVWYSQTVSPSSAQLAYHNDQRTSAENQSVKSIGEISEAAHDESMGSVSGEANHSSRDGVISTSPNEKTFNSSSEDVTNSSSRKNVNSSEMNTSASYQDQDMASSVVSVEGESQINDANARQVRVRRQQKGGLQQSPTAGADYHQGRDGLHQGSVAVNEDVRESSNEANVIAQKDGGQSNEGAAIESGNISDKSGTMLSDENRSHMISGRQPQLAYIPPVEVHLPEKPKPDAVALMLARLNDLEKEEQKKENKEKSYSKEKLWTSVGFAAGAVTGGNASVSTKPSAMSTLVASTSNDIADKEANASGISYSVGVNMGTSLSKRWVLQGGLNYMTQSSDYTVENAFGSADLKTFTPASINGIDLMNDDPEAADAKMVTTAPYNVNNNVQYLSIPLQAGYLVINRKFGIQLNAGVSTDMFLKNEKSADGDNLQKIDQGRDESPYRPFNFSGLMGAEFSYKLGHRYRVALNPGMRYPFSSIYKSDVGVKANPLTYDVGLRFRYIFQ